MEHTPAESSKFDSRADELVYAITFDGSCESTGDVNENGRWYGLIEFDDTDDEIIAAIAAEYDLIEPAGAIVSEDSQGFVKVGYYDDGIELRKEWAQCEAECALGDESDDDES